MGRFEKISTAGSTAFQYYYNAASNETQRRNYLSNPEVDQFYSRDSLNRMSARFAKQTDGPTFSAEYYTYDRMSRLIGINRWPENKQDLFWYYWDGDMLGPNTARAKAWRTAPAANSIRGRFII